LEADRQPDEVIIGIRRNKTADRLIQDGRRAHEERGKAVLRFRSRSPVRRDLPNRHIESRSAQMGLYRELIEVCDLHGRPRAPGRQTRGK
jgi:hypothetical protein